MNERAERLTKLVQEIRQVRSATGFYEGCSLVADIVRKFPVADRDALRLGIINGVGCYGFLRETGQMQ